MSVTASQVKELRDLTGAGMMDCKRALEETGGDVAEARRLLRERGVAAAGKRAGRATSEGKVAVRVEDSLASIVAVGCETEPVANNQEFLAFVGRLLDVVHADGAGVAERLEDERIDLVARIGENIAVVGAARLEAGAGEILAGYVHPPAEKIGVLVRAVASPELARMVAMHVSFAKPRFRSREEVPEHEVAQERAIYEKVPEVASKPEHIRPNIVEGMLAKRFFAEVALLDQAWIHDPAKTVGQALAEHGADVREFVRYSVAE